MNRRHPIGVATTDANREASTITARPDNETSQEPAEVETNETAPDNDGSPRSRWPRLLAFTVLPALALLLTLTAGNLKWQDSSVRDADRARAHSVQAAREDAVALLSYQPDTVATTLHAARDRLTGSFRDAYTSLINDVVIPGAQQKHISATATVAAVAAVSATAERAVVLMFINQTVVVGKDPPTETASCVRVGLDNVDGRWLVSAFDPA